MNEIKTVNMNMNNGKSLGPDGSPFGEHKAFSDLLIPKSYQAYFQEWISASFLIQCLYFQKGFLDYPPAPTHPIDPCAILL